LPNSWSHFFDNLFITLLSESLLICQSHLILLFRNNLDDDLTGWLSSELEASSDKR